MEFTNLVDKRYTAKSYKPNTEIKEEDLKKIIHAIHFAPTASNLQNSRVLIIKNKELKEEIAKFFMPLNRARVSVPPILILFIGKPIESVLENGAKHIWENAISGLDMSKPDLEKYVDSVVKFYDGYIQSKIELSIDVIASSIQCVFAMAQAFDLGYDSTIMLGYKKDKLKEFLVDKTFIEPNEQVNLSIAIGNALENDETNKLSSIKKRAPIKNIIRII